MTFWVLWGLSSGWEVLAADCGSAPAGLSGWWTGDSNGNDVIGGNNGVLQDGATAGAAGRVGGAFAFDGTNSYVAIADAPALKPANLTIELWVNFSDLNSARSGFPPSMPAAGSQYIVFKQNSRVYNFEGYALEKHRTVNGDVFMFTVCSASGQDLVLLGSTLISTSVWYHVAAVRGANTLQLYVDGQLENQASVSFAQDYGTQPLYFGTSQQSYWDAKLKGRLDEVSLYNRALTGVEIAGVYAAGAAGKCKGPNITAQPQSTTNVAGTTASFSVTATGYGTLSYQWRHNGGNISGATGSSLLLTGVQSSQAGSYSVVVTNLLGSATSAVAVLTVLDLPVITAQPQSRTNVLGTTASFSVTATGAAPLSYQWRHDGATMAGATGSSLTLNNVQPNQAGSYSVVVTNPLGAATSAVAVLTVWVPPAIAAQPQSRTNVLGTTASFSATATGTAPLSYQWWFNGGPIAGATGSSWARSGVMFGDAGSYRVVVTNAAGVVTSEVALLTVVCPVVSVSPGSLPAGLMGSAYSQTLTGSGGMGPYAFSVSGGTLPGGLSLSSSGLLSGVPSGVGTNLFTVRATDTNGCWGNQGYSLVITAVPPVIVAQPQSRTNALGTTASFSVTATGTSPLSYQWWFNGGPIAGATGSSLARSGVMFGDGGSYRVVVTNVAGVVTSEVALLTVVCPAVSVSPGSLPAGLVDSSYSQTLTGSGGMGPYAFSVSGGTLPGGLSLSSSGLLSGVPGGVGTNLFTVRATDTNGCWGSQGYSLVITAVPPVIVAQPQSRTNVAGTTASFSVTAAGTVPLSYQWWFNGGPIAGATGSSLVKSSVPFGDAGSYRVVVTNVAGVVTSEVALLTVICPAVSVSPGSLPEGVAGRSYSQTLTASGGMGPYEFSVSGGTLPGGLSLSSGGVLSGVPSEEGTNLFTVRATDTNGCWGSRGYSLMITGAVPVILAQPQSRTNVLGTTASFSVTAAGTAPLSYQWWFNGAAISGATASSYVRGGVTFGDGGGYRVVITNALGATTSAVAALTVVCPAVTVSPASLPDALVASGYSQILTASGGTGPYVFMMNGGGLPLGLSLTAGGALSGVPSRVGTNIFTVKAVYTNGCYGTREYSLAVTGVPPVITQQPQSRTNNPGTTASFSVTAVGTLPLIYQWEFNGAAISGATESTFVRAGVTSGHEGAYRVVVTNAAGAATSAVALLTVVCPAVTVSPASLPAGLFGSEYSQTLTASGGVGSYAFSVSSGVLPAGLSLSSAGLLSGVPNAVGTNTFTVRAAYTNGCWGHQDYSLAITGAPPVIVAQPQSRTSVAGAAVTFTASAAGTPPLGYQWQFNGAALADSEIISGASSNTLELAVVQPGDAGSYTLVVSNAAGAVTSAVATLTVTVPPAINVAPANRSAPAGASVLFSVTASGTLPLSYQWQFNGTGLPGATGMNLVVSHVQATNAGSYTVIVTNVAGAVTSGVAVLTVLAPPMFVAQPESRTNGLGSVATFSVTAAGSGPLAYQWYWGGASLVDGGRISGAVLDRLQVAAVQAGDAGDYRVVVSNAYGAVTSTPATLTVVVPPAIVVPPESLTVVLGASVAFSVTASGSPPLSYQWWFNGQPITGATGTSHSLGSAQPADAGAYSVVVTNAGGAVTSTVANLTVLVPPFITLQPASLNVSPGMDAGFSVAASGTPPLGYQWRFNGQAIVGVTGASLLLTNVQPANAGGYTVVVTNAAGSVTSAVANLAVIPGYQPDSQSAGAVVLVNSQSAKYLDFQHFIQPYLDNFGFPYTVQDISTNAPGPGLTNCAVVVVGHSQLDTNLDYLTPAAQASLSQAVSNGTGLVSFDNDLSAGGLGRYQFVQDIFGFTYGSGGAGTNVTLPPTEPASQMHFITARHPTNDTVALRSSLTLPGLTVPAAGTTLARVGSRPLVVINRYGQGRALQWSSYGWTVSTVLGPVAGLDDLVWRGVVWAARKPFVMRGLPPLVTMRVDDVKGPLDWIHYANAVGFKPFVTVFMSNLVAASVSDLRGLTTSGKATASIHSFDCCNRFFYFNHAALTANSDLVQSNNFYLGTQWHLSNGIPISKVCAPHYSEIGPNCFAGLKAWGIEYLPIEVVPGTVEYTTPGADWLMAGPYRRYETPRPGQVKLPTYYADWLTVPGHPEFDGQFFNVYSEPRDAVACGEWCPDNDVAGSASRAVRIARRGLDSMVLCTIYGHEYDFYTISPANWPATFQGITNELASYNPAYVTLDYACQYVRATRTSRLVSSAYDPVLGQVTARFTGLTDLDTRVYVFTGEDAAITHHLGLVPAFAESPADPVVVFGPPAILTGPLSQTSYEGATVEFSVGARGQSPLSYQWYRNGTNALSDGGGVSGASSAALTLDNVLAGDTGAYNVVVSNHSGSVASAAAVLTVLHYPVFLTAPTVTQGAFGFTLSGQPGQVYLLEASTNLQQWAPLAWLTNLTGEVYFTDPAASNATARFYRARIQ